MQIGLTTLVGFVSNQIDLNVSWTLAGWFAGGVGMLFGLLVWLIALLVGTHPRVATRLLYVLVLG